MTIRPIALVLACAALLGAAPKASADPQRYPAKFICNNFGGDALSGLVAVSGTYRTAINVFNPNAKSVSLLRTIAKSALTGPGTTTSDVMVLPAGRAEVIDCSTIANVAFGTPFGQLPAFAYEGFVTLSTIEDLDVAVIYTAGSELTGVTTEQVLVIEPKKGALKLLNLGGITFPGVDGK
jgi:hypothetical protein